MNQKISKINIIFYFIFLIAYFELLTKILIVKSASGLIYTTLFSIPLIILLVVITKLFNEKINKILTFILTLIITFFYCFQCIFFNLFSVMFSFNTIGLAQNIGEFQNMIWETIFKNIGVIILYLIPFILLIIFNKRLNFKRNHPKTSIVRLALAIIIYVICLLSLFFDKKELYGAYNLYYNINNEIKTVEKFGLATYMRLDIKRVIFGFEEQLITNNNVDPNKKDEEPNKPKEVTYNVTNIDFDNLIANASNNTIKNTLSYFQNTNPTNQNDYTGMFKGKNLIFILAEGFNMIAVDKDLTPTLYKLTHEGFVFNNFYSPVFLSTTGGEFQATTGLVPTQETLSLWKSNKPTITYALGNSFKNIGYNIQSYHNWTYTYYHRDKTMATLGFTDYTGCGNGMEKMINCAWLPSDIEMFNATLPLYKDKTPFTTYYVSVSGHAPYAYNSSGNSIALKNISLVENLPYSNSVKAYLATQIEFDRALEALIKALDEAGILDDTVISFVGDHYPYTLSVDEINEISTYQRDEIIEVNHSNFVIWNNKMEKPITINKVGSQIDVLPTLLNLFGVEYDSRLIVGKDILSDNPGLAIFSNRSWVSDYGTYNTGNFTLKEGKTLDNEDEYIKSMNNLVATNFTLSNNIIKNKIYDYIFK